MEKHEFIGTHIISEMYEIEDELINNNELIINAILNGVKRSGANCEGVLCKTFLPTGFSVVLLLSESHASVHTYPEKNALFADAFTCGEKCKTKVIIDELADSLKAKKHKARIITRGERNNDCRTL